MRSILFLLAFVGSLLGSAAQAQTTICFKSATGSGCTPVSAASPLPITPNGSDTTATGTITATAQSVTIPTNGKSTVGVSITGTWSGALTIKSSVDYGTVGAASATFGVTTGVSLTNGTISSAITANGLFQVNASGFSAIQIYGTNIVSGTVNVTLLGSAGISTVMADNPFPVTWTTDPCTSGTKSSAVINVTSATTTSLVAVSGSTTVYVCGFSMTIAPSATSADTALFEYGTGAACTSPTALTGTFGNGDLTSATGVAPVRYGSGGATIFKSTASNGICILTAGTAVNVQGVLTYVQQ